MLRAAALGLLVIAANGAVAEAKAQPRFSNVFQRGMVLQRGQPIKVWGFHAADGERLTVALGPSEDKPIVSAEAQAGAGGSWTVVLGQPPASATGVITRLSLRNASRSVQVLEDVVLGDVYLFSGQSNADLPEAYAFQDDPKAQAEEERAADELGRAGLVRLMTVPTRCGLTYDGTELAKELAEVPDCKPCPSPWGPQEPVNKCNALGGAKTGSFHYSYCGCDALQWTRATGPMLRGFSAVAWFTGRALSSWAGLRAVPIGLVRSSWGATSIAAWSSGEAVDQCPQHGMPVHSFAPHFKSSLWANMIAPLLGLRFSAVVWVHGARNVGDDTPYMGARYYSCALPALINDWRLKFEQAALPFLVVEMPVYCNSQDFATWHTWCTERQSRLSKPDEHLPEMRMAQLQAEKLPHVYVVSSVDQGSLFHAMGGTIHSPRKPELGERLALAARAGIHGDTCAVWSGPIALRAWRSRPGWVDLCFDARGGGGLVLNMSLHCPTPVLPVYCTGAGFEVKVGSVWMPPFSASLSGSQVSLEVPIVAGLVERVRYAWADWPVSVLKSLAGQPARTFDMVVQGEADSECPRPQASEACRFETVQVAKAQVTTATATATTATSTATSRGSASAAPAPSGQDAGAGATEHGGVTAVVFAAAGAAVSTVRQIDHKAKRYRGIVAASLLLNLVGVLAALVCCILRRPASHSERKASNPRAKISYRAMELKKANEVPRPSADASPGSGFSMVWSGLPAVARPSDTSIELPILEDEDDYVEPAVLTHAGRDPGSSALGAAVKPTVPLDLNHANASSFDDQCEMIDGKVVASYAL